jgi:hypothetical protein
VLLAVAVSGVLILNRGSVFIVMLSPILFISWTALWLATRLVRKRTDPFSAACFASLVQAWFFAAMFVME